MAQSGDWLNLARQNTDAISRKIDDFEQKVEKGDFSTFWQMVKEVTEMFRELKPTIHEDRARLWSTLGELCGRAKSEQSRQWSTRVDVSRQKRTLVESKLNEAHHQANGAETGQDLRVADELLQQALAWTKDGFSGFNFTTQYFALNDGKMLKEDHDACWERWKGIKERVKFRRQDFCNANYGALCAASGDTQNRPIGDT